MKLSACWITKNEAENLARSIESLRDAVDELIVVDTGSTDSTVEVAKSFGARTEHFEWIADFSAARNYALSLATGDLVFFLDADEWFVPALTAADRALAEQAFGKNPHMDLLRVPIENLDKNTGVIVSSNSVIRLFRNRPDICYHGKIHESVKRRDGQNLNCVDFNQWKLHHTGYSAANMPGKLSRNIELLEAALDDPGADVYMQHTYLMREYYLIRKHGKSLEHLDYMLRHASSEVPRCCIQYADNFMDFVYCSLQLAVFNRGKVSRKQIYRALVAPVVKSLPDYPGTPTLELYYQVQFDCRDDILLQRLGPALKAAATKAPSPVTSYKMAEDALCTKAALCLWRRRKMAEAMEYAVRAVSKESQVDIAVIRILLSCIKGQPAQDIILFLNSIYDMSKETMSVVMLNSLRIDGFNDVYLYYLKKHMDTFGGTKGQALYLQLVCGRYGESVAAALSMYDEASAPIIGEHLFMTAICSGDEAIYRNNAQYLTRFATVLDVFFYGTRLRSPSNHELQILHDYYSDIAFAAGVKTADRLRAIFAAEPQHCFSAKAAYCINSSLFEELLREDTAGIDPNDFKCHESIIQANIATKRYKAALGTIKYFLKAGTISEKLLAPLLVLADCDDPAAKNEAAALCDTYIPLYEATIDLRDTVNTGVIFNEFSPKQQKSLKNLTQAQFEKQLAADRALASSAELETLQKQAAALYEEKDMPAMAMQAYRWLLAHDCDAAESRRGLARAFTKLGNLPVAQRLSAGC